jgi:hypothetical protein
LLKLQVLKYFSSEYQYLIDFPAYHLMSTLSPKELKQEIYGLQSQRLVRVSRLHQLQRSLKNQPVADAMLAKASIQILQVEVMELEQRLAPLLRQRPLLLTQYEIWYEQERGTVGSDETTWHPDITELWLATKCQVDTTKQDFTPPVNWEALQLEIQQAILMRYGRAEILAVRTISQ